MNVLPRLLYLFQAIPIRLPRSFFVLLSKLVSLFVWAQGSPRIAKSTLVRPKLRGGLAVPDFKAYFVAAATARILDWFHRRSSKLWVHLESLLSNTPLTALPWLPRGVISKSDLSNIPFVAAATLTVCRTYIPRNGLFSPDGPLTPVRGHPSLAISVLLNSPLLPDPGQPFLFRQILTSSSLKSYEELVPDTARSFLMRLNAIFYRTNRDQLCLHRDLSPFESLCIDKSPPSHLVSVIYSLVCATPLADKTSFQLSWEKELECTISLEDWSKSFLLAHKSTVSSKAQELNFKILSRWYRVPSLLHAIYPNTSHLSWRCNGAEGTMTHIWWGCPVIQPFWTKVIDVVQKITGIKLASDPAPLLLFMIPLSAYAIRQSLIAFLLTFLSISLCLVNIVVIVDEYCLGSYMPVAYHTAKLHCCCLYIFIPLYST